MTPYYADEAVTLYHGDGLKVVPALGLIAVDVIIFDPPYSAHVHKSNRRGLTAHAGVFSERRDLGFDSLGKAAMKRMAALCGEMALRWVLVFSDSESDYLWRRELQRNRLEYIRTCFWEKVGGAPQFTGDRPAVACEAITVCHPAGRKRWNGGGKQGIYKHPIVVGRGGPNEVRVHTTQKPLGLMCELVGDFSEEGETVLDFTAGSGTTGVAAKLNGRKAILVERDEKSCETAAKRLQAAEPGQLFAREPRARQTSMTLESPECGRRGDPVVRNR